MKTREQVILNLEESLVGLRYRELAILAIAEEGVARYHQEILEKKDKENDVEILILQKTLELLRSED